jgi:leader peptidase (prepilin peptidase)/N-methyltransferase
MIAAVVAALAGVPLGLVIDAVAMRLITRRDAAMEEDDESGERVWRRGRVQEYLLADGATWRKMAIVAASVAIAFVLGWQYGAGWELAIAGIYAAVLVACTVTDLLDGRLPNLLTYPAIVLAFVVGMSVSAADRIDVLGGAAFSGGLFFLMALLPGAGWGDAKLGLFTGLALGLELAIPAVVLTALTGAVVSVTVLLVTRMKALHQPIPYGPYIAFGALAVILAGGTAFADV